MKAREAVHDVQRDGVCALMIDASRSVAGMPRRLVGMTERSTVSTTPLRAFLPVHAWPINLVVYQGSFV